MAEGKVKAGGRAKAVSGWTAEDAVVAAERLLSETGLPLPKKPEGFAGEYEFPQDPTKLSGLELAQLMGRLAAWRGYLMRVMGLQEVKLMSSETVYDIMLGAAMSKAQGDKREVKEVLKARAIIEDKNLTRMTQRITELQAQSHLLKTQDAVYGLQWAALSREQGRRSDEIRERSSFGGGLREKQ